MTQYITNNSSNSGLIQKPAILNAHPSIISTTSTTNKINNSILFKPTITKKLTNKSPAKVERKTHETSNLPSIKLKIATNGDVSESSCNTNSGNQENNNNKRKNLKYSSEDSNQEDYDEEYELSCQNEDKLNGLSPKKSPSEAKQKGREEGEEDEGIKKMKIEVKVEEEKKHFDKNLKLNNTVSMKKKRKKLIMKKFKHNKSLTDILLNLSDTIFDIFNSLISIEHDFNGGSKIITCKYDDLVQKLGSNRQLMKQFANYFLSLCYYENEKTKRAEYTLGVVHNCATGIPDILEYFSENHPMMNVKSSILTNNKEIQTLKMSEYKNKVFESYYNGTYRFGPLLQTSIVGVKNEEIGGYFPDFIEKYLNNNVFIKLMLPWGKLSIRSNTSPQESNDGPIIWSRPGEQMLPTTIVRELEKKCEKKKK